jgi:eukaryotic-like serine/threonine-protein kinase
MADDKRGDAPGGVVGTDPTLTPSKILAVDPTLPLSEPPARPSGASAALPARYQLGTRLGAGGMGEVVLASDQQIGRDVAIKRMLGSSPALEARFLREARIQGRLEHPAIVPVHELATDADGRPFFVMKRITGTTLADTLANQDAAFSRQKLLRAFADVCLAVEFAHSRGIVHRDLKPANIMLGDFGEVYVLDWGIARIVGDADDDIASTIQKAGPGTTEMTEIGAVIGTLGYMSPEQLRGQPIDGRSDVFALGCILFEIIGGKPLLPRTLDALEEAFSTIVRRASSRARLRDIPPELVALCVEATQLDVERRLKSARELAESIEKFLDGDRDVALRKELAASHVATARAALAAGDTEAERSTAMRELGRSIALDPSGSEAAEMVGRLMLEPPRRSPLEVDKRMESIADATTRRRSVLVALFAVGFLAFLPFLMWMGIRDMRIVVAFTVLVSMNGLYAFRIARMKNPASVVQLNLGVLLNSLVIGTVSHMFTPFLVAPGIAAVTVMMFLSDPRLRAKLVIPIVLAAVTGPWLLEVAGLVSPTIEAYGGNLLLRSPAVTAAMPATSLALALFVTSMVGLAGLVAKQLGDTVQTSLRSIELQAWHLRQLMR